MADEKSCAKRVARLRELMEDRGYDAVVLRNNPDLRWLTGCERTFDDETAHTVVITADRQMLHTDSRYYNTPSRIPARSPSMTSSSTSSPLTPSPPRPRVCTATS